MDIQGIVDLVAQESERAVTMALDEFVGTLQPGVVLQPWFIVIGIVQQAFLNLVLDLTQNFRQIPIRVAAQVLAQEAKPEDSTKVVTLLEAKKMAINLAVGAVYDLSGGRPPATSAYVGRAGSLKTFRQKMIRLEERQILGKPLQKFFSLLRMPAVLAVRVAIFVWQTMVTFMAIGAVLVVWQLVNSDDWEEKALSQSHPRKRIRATINKRL